MLIQQLRALESDGVVRRIVYDEVPPHVEYELTPAGAELAMALYALHDWAEQSCSAAPPRAGEDPGSAKRADAPRHTVGKVSIQTISKVRWMMRHPSGRRSSRSTKKPVWMRFQPCPSVPPS